MYCTEYFVREQEAYNATQAASRFSKTHRPSFIYFSKLEVPIQVHSGVFMSCDLLCPLSFLRHLFKLIFKIRNGRSERPFQILRVNKCKVWSVPVCRRVCRRAARANTVMLSHRQRHQATQKCTNLEDTKKNITQAAS